jgi:YD repeat-containing protein
MKKKLIYIFTTLSLLILAACTDNGPGPLEGTWRMGGLIPMTIQFRPGETEALGIIEKVTYDVQGNTVLVTYTDGIARGMTMRYTMTGNDTAQTELGTFQRVQ